MTLATRIAVSPSQDPTAAQACGMRWRWRPCTAMSPPRASSQDRVSSEKYALCAFSRRVHDRERIGGDDHGDEHHRPVGP